VVSARAVGVRHYTFVDYATQVYALVVILLVFLFHNATVEHWGWLVAAHIAGIVAVHALIEWNARKRPGKAVDFLRHFYPVLLYIWFFCETGWINRMFFKEFMDPVAVRWDQALFGFQPSIVWMEKMPYLPLSELFYASYFSYYLMIGGVGFALFLRERRQFFHFISVVSFVFYLCYIIYIILPIIGPRVFFDPIAGYLLPENVRLLAPTSGYPESVQSGWFFQLMRFVYRVFESSGAAMPSSHVAVALCTVFFSFLYLRPIRYPHLVLAILLCLSTVYCRYHYAVDVLTGALTAAVLVPFGNWLYLKSEQKSSAS
jgi:membrane-associated phospholipid phosphatase